ncbi:sulfite oxidase [Pseudalkalibacillus decolorationis]|uniref:sulfite oxidase n=1 Tax=Pseudalkalibacillus decolorationis TaxID=163879 RepID=UPI00214809DD|nr:sulfite oxidase [Pseudalkalibacillus decolorationis]
MKYPLYSFVRPYLMTRSLQPENQETPIQFIKTDTMDNRLFYRRNHFSYPTISHSNYWLPINGLVTTPKWFSMNEIVRLPSKTIKVVLECSGDKRDLFEPKVFGEQWGKGAISQGNWKGVSLRTLLKQVGMKDDAKQVVVEGYDNGKRTDLDTIHTYARGLPIDKALHPDTIIAYEYNNQPIPFKHGYPLRLIVPEWYAMASVKWIKQISIIDSNFSGPFQSIDYVYYPNKENDKNAFPVTTININSTIQKPLNMEVLNTGNHLIEGIAWTGKGYITKVEISTDNGETWLKTNLCQQPKEDYGWSSWVFEWSVSAKGEYSIMTKATDSYNRIQPTTPFWNRKGYGYNGIEIIKVKIE